jgi:hypothetical protein
MIKVLAQPRSRSDCGLVERVSIVPYRKKAVQWVSSDHAGVAKMKAGVDFS